VLKLEELGKLDIEESLSTYFPDFKFKNIKVKDLLKHSTGLWDYMYLTEAYWEEVCAPDQSDIINLINDHQRILSFRPGRRFDYNNTNYALLVALVEKLSSQNFEDFLNEHFFDPYCIEDTYVGVDSRKLNHVANGFQPYRRGYIELPPSFHNGALGDKGIHINAKGLWEWFEALKNHKSLSKSSVERMFNLDSYKFYKYGMGFRTRLRHDGELEVYHDGLWDGFRNGLHYYPVNDLTVIVLSHTQNKNKTYFQNYLKNKAISMVNDIE
jgi:CubicO group peptidase (beta-lactamase class C family)